MVMESAQVHMPLPSPLFHSWAGCKCDGRGSLSRIAFFWVFESSMDANSVVELGTLLSHDPPPSLPLYLCVCFQLVSISSVPVECDSRFCDIAFCNPPVTWRVLFPSTYIHPCLNSPHSPLSLSFPSLLFHNK